MILYNPEEIKKIMEDNYDKSMDLVAFYHNLLVAFGLEKDGYCYKMPQPATEPKKEWEILAWDNRGKHIEQMIRLSDCEVFTVGDEIKFNRYDFTRQFYIKEFVIQDGNMYLKDKHDGMWILNNVDKLPAKTPLFTSEDGVPIYEDSELWYCRVEDGLINKWGAKKITPLEISSKSYKWFSTKEAAKDYWDKHKPEIEVLEFGEYEEIYPILPGRYQFKVSNVIPDNKFQQIIQAIEDILNK